ncbi:hypothetical protein AGMMS50267_04070 [Spirochaetia bacterium]|nr:hypothetical protein AGMMS50267_04070 [Spirochaetia bacterium]
MKRLVSVFTIFFAVSLIYAQTAETTAPQLDGVVKTIAADLNKRLTTEGAQKVAVSQFTFQDGIPSLGSYWNTQLVQELAAIPSRSWTLLSGPAADADWTISGEIVEIVNTVRVYTRIIRSRDRAIASSTQSDFNRDPFITELLAGGGRSGGGNSSSVVRDAYEADSMANPLAAELAAGEDGSVVNRTIHNSSDEDFFLLTPDKDGIMTAETTGSMDTYMELYDADTGGKISDNDDGAEGNNARIRQTVRAGSRYIAKVRGYHSQTGNYGFRAYLVAEVRIEPDEYESDDTFETAKDISIGAPQQHTFHSKDDADWVKFQIASAGRYTIRARGVTSNRLDTYIELFDSDQHAIDEDDDGGDNVDSRLSRPLEAGTYYLKVECIDSSPNQPYTISITAE